MRQSGISWAVALLLPSSVLLAIGLGKVGISPAQLLGISLSKLGVRHRIAYSEVQEAVLIGASLGLCGAAMQGLYRNALADPALIGISSGASLAAVSFIVIGGRFAGFVASVAGLYSMAAVTFAGALLSSAVVYRLARVRGRLVVSTMLLAGIGVNAVAMAGTGVFTYAATETQLRSITFWTLGSLGGASWTQVLALLPFAAASVLVLPSLAKPLNAFSLGEHNAAHLGVSTERVKRIIMVLTALSVGASVAVAGIIGFVGLLVPNILRMIVGPDYRRVLPLSAIAGAVLLVVADLIARTAFGQSELPIGILTALLGGPFFIYLLLRERNSHSAL